MDILCVVGGKSIQKDIEGYRKSPSPDLLVATPGRLNDLLDNHGLSAKLQGLKHLIFDEADQVGINVGCLRTSNSPLEAVLKPNRRSIT